MASKAYENAYRRYQIDKKYGNSQSKKFLESLVASNGREFLSWLIAASISICLIWLASNGEITTFKGCLIYFLGYYLLGSIFLSLSNGSMLIEDWLELRSYRQIENGEKKNE